MTAAMSHRGPDDSGVASARTGGLRLALGSTRLAILDPSPAGHMPMHDPASGNWIVYSGEVYNYKELRGELESLGEGFRSGTDTEVVLKAYRRWRDDMLNRLRGMFAFAIWDQARQELLLARDRLGEKPLYYCQAPGETFLFASEVRALLASGAVERRLETEALSVYLANGFLAAPLTAVRGVSSLRPGHWLRVSAGGGVIRTGQYWRPGEAASSNGRADSGEQLSSVLAEAVRLRLVSDVPIGAFLSGGLDSSIIVALAAAGGPTVRTFSVTFDEPAYDESPYSDWVARRFATRHSEIRLRPCEFAGWLPEAVDAMDQPSFDGVNTYCVSRAAKAAGLTVALSGLGGDETFGGYPFFNTVPWVDRCARLAAASPAPARRFLSRQLGRRGFRVSAPWKLAEAWGSNGARPAPPALPAYQAAQILFPEWVRRRLISADAVGDGGSLVYSLPGLLVEQLRAEAEAAGPGNLVSLYALRLFLGERCLRDTDAMSMAVSLEVRPVFTDHRFLEAAWKVPAARRCRGAPDKPFLWSLFRPLLGDDFPVRRKQGFRLPLDEWLRAAATRAWIGETLANRALLESVGLAPDAVNGLLEAYRKNRPKIPWSRLWAVFVLARWCQKNRVTL